MRSAVEHVFDDADQFQASVRAADVALVLLGRGPFDGSLLRIDFNDLWMQRGEDSLARIARIGISKARAVLHFTCTDDASVFTDGVEIPPHTMFLYQPGQELHQRTHARLQWGTLSLSPDYLAKVTEHVRIHPNIPSGGLQIRPPAEIVRRLRYLHAAAAGRLRDPQQTGIAREPSRALEQALIETFLACVRQRSDHEIRPSLRNRRIAVGRLEALLEANQDRPLYMLEICQALGMHERMLQLCCQDFFGMSPTRYLRLRRLHLARRALRQEDRATGSVTEVATRFGFWELGRFAIEYRRQFGESPSTTLRQPAEDPNRMGVASRLLHFSETA